MALATSVNAKSADWEQGYDEGWERASCSLGVVLDVYDECLEEQTGTIRAAIKTCTREVWDNDDEAFVDQMFERSIEECE